MPARAITRETVGYTKFIAIGVLLFSCVVSSDTKEQSHVPQTFFEDYLGNQLPGTTPQLFAPVLSGALFDIDIETCSECGGDVRIIASIEDPVVIRTILAHLDKKGALAADSLLPDCRASPGPPMGLLV